jgi:amino-acid N-acetyltransferase
VQLGLTVRDARRADWPRGVTLLRAAELPLAGIPDDLAGFIVAEEGGEVIGLAGLELYGPVGMVRSVVVRSDRRGVGCGEALMHATLERAARQRLETLVLLTTTAADWFERWGFGQTSWSELPEEVRCSPLVQSGCPGSAVVMRRVLEREGTAFR